MRRMAYQPAFMQRLDDFKAALARVRTPGEWLAFKTTWFDDLPWPKRSAEALQALREAPPPPTAGRTFRRSPLPDDLTPEARYQYFAALQAGFGVLFAPEEAPGQPGVAVRHHCPACELFSDEPGGPTCPGCGRPLLLMRLDPPRGR
jgi:hypothetical protein